MPNADLKVTPDNTAEEICLALSRKQFLRPHQSINDVLTDLGICPIAVNEAVHWLELQGTLAVGRLRASELMQLSRCVHRMWEQATNRVPQTT